MPDGTQAPQNLKLGDGRPLRLQEEPLGAGGEGTVYAAANRHGHAAKIYKAPEKRPDIEAKIRAMVQEGFAWKSEFATFPVDTIHHPDGRFAGFLMKAVQGRRPLHELYGPVTRKERFPEADYGFLVRAATNVARAVASVHVTGCVIGDVNAGGMLVDEHATVMLVDADSFQFSSGGKRYPCVVGTPEYTPTELQGLTLSGITRTADHDNFGLAVLIFQTLMMGVHSFNGVYTGDTEPPPQLTDFIRMGYYPHAVPDETAHDATGASHTQAGAQKTGAQHRRTVPLDPPPGLPALDGFSGELASLFARAFVPEKGVSRPTARQWVEALERLEQSLKHCKSNDYHQYPGHMKACPWCAREATFGTPLFVQKGAAPAHTAAVQANLKALQQKKYRKKRVFSVRRMISALWRLPLWLIRTTARLIAGLVRLLLRTARIAIILGVVAALLFWGMTTFGGYDSQQLIARTKQVFSVPMAALNDGLAWASHLWHGKSGRPAPSSDSQKKRTRHGLASTPAASGAPPGGGGHAALPASGTDTAPSSSAASPASSASPATGSAAIVTITDRVLYMQRTLRHYGYPAPLTGSFDRNTRAYAVEFLYNATGKPVQESQSVQDFYQAFRRVQGGPGLQGGPG